LASRLNEWLLSGEILGLLKHCPTSPHGAVRAFRSGQQFCRQRSFLEWWEYVLVTPLYGPAAFRNGFGVEMEVASMYPAC
jgi:hypothetical protein